MPRATLPPSLSLLPRLRTPALPRLLRHAALVALATLATLATPRRSHACSADMPVVHQVRFAGADVVALADPITGSVVKLGTTASVRTSHDDFLFHAHAVFSTDGATMWVARNDYADEMLGAACLSTFVHLERVDLATGARTRIRRLRSGGVNAIRLTPDEQHLILDAGDRDGEPVVHVFDLRTGDRLRVTRDLSGEVVDDTTLFVTDLEGGRRLADLVTGATVARLASSEAELHVVPGFGSRDAFTLSVRENDRIVLADVTRDGRRLRMRRLRWRTRGTFVQSSSDGTRVLVLRGRHARVLDRATGAVVMETHTTYTFTAAALRPDGGELALVSIPRPPPDPDAAYRLDAFQPPTILRITPPAEPSVVWTAPPARAR